MAQNYLEILDSIIEDLNSNYGNFTDLEFKDLPVYDKFDYLVEDNNWNEKSLAEIQKAKDKIREAYLLIKDFKEKLLMSD